MSEVESEEVKDRFTPQHPLPEAIQKMDRDETVCRYCGVSYLIHSEIKALEKKLKALEKELEHHGGCEERENKLKEELQVLQDQRGEFEMNLTVKDAAISTLTNNLKNSEATCERLRNEKDDVVERLHKVENTNKTLKERNNHLERTLPNLKSALHAQKMSLNEIHLFMEQRDAQMKEELSILLSHVRSTCENEIKEKEELQQKISELQSSWGSATSETEDMKKQLARQEQQILQLDKLFQENKQLQQKCAALETAQAEVKTLQNRLSKLKLVKEENKNLHEKCAALENVQAENKSLHEKCTVLETVQAENKVLQEKCSELVEMRDNLRRELEESVEKCRQLQMETHQFKEQFKSKSSEMEEVAAVQRRKEMAMEMTTQKLKSDLKQRESDLLGAKRDLKELQIKFDQHQQMEADLNRKTSKTLNETKDLKESFFKAKEEIEHLKEEREAMITSHQNRIEQLRESFKEKLSEADNWQEKLEAAIQAEKQRHARELQDLETRLKESFVMELEIEKGKYRELMKKYQTGSQETEEKLRAQLQSIESRYKAEIEDLNELLAENRRKSKEMEDELRKEIASLKSIIKDLEARLARLDVGNEDLVIKLKTQLRETHQELEDTRQILDKQTKAGDVFQEEIKNLQETVQKECEERFELTEALSAAKEELLQLKKPAGGYISGTPRQLTNMSLPSDEPQQSNSSTRRSVSEPQPLISNRPITSKPHTYGGGIKREYTITNSNTMVFMGDSAGGTRAVGGSTKRTGGSLAENRRRIAAILGRK
ncbi:restin homolog isoform X2 [Mercenaria mercenaria]|uniref:restin homolog isoform X2 n=1 Tax=Mercenaria mercenaria TaxID=6596 RepID=UPI00234F5F21|nr:restin homolog isoform X2 [Mercenaria mercenaria]